MTWTAQLYRDGEAVTDPVPIDLWDVGTIAGPLVSTITGGTVSIAKAVHEANQPEPERNLFSDP